MANVHRCLKTGGEVDIGPDYRIFSPPNWGCGACLRAEHAQAGQPAFSDLRFRLSNGGGQWAVGAILSPRWL